MNNYKVTLNSTFWEIDVLLQTNEKLSNNIHTPVTMNFKDIKKESRFIVAGKEVVEIAKNILKNKK